MENVDAIIEEFKIDMNYSPIDEKDLESASYIVIRHGYSLFNHKVEEVVKLHGLASEQEHKLRGDASYYDPGLHQVGVLQCEANQAHINKIKFKVVFVSPM